MPASLQGKSLRPLLHDPRATIRASALSIHNRHGGGVRLADWHYMNYGEKGEELYDMKKDPHQYTNVVGDPDYASILRRVRSEFHRRMSEL